MIMLPPHVLTLKILFVDISTGFIGDILHWAISIFCLKLTMQSKEQSIIGKIAAQNSFFVMHNVTPHPLIYDLSVKMLGFQWIGWPAGPT